MQGELRFMLQHEDIEDAPEEEIDTRVIVRADMVVIAIHNQDGIEIGSVTLTVDHREGDGAAVVIARVWDDSQEEPIAYHELAELELLRKTEVE